MVKKFLMLTFAAILTIFYSLPPVSAEQPAAESYRQIFRAGKFYVVFRMYLPLSGNHKYRSANFTLAGENGKRMYRITKAAGIEGKMARSFFEEKSGIPANIYFNTRTLQQTHYQENLSAKKWPDVLYQDGKYYQFKATEKSVNAVVLPEEMLNSPLLNSDEGWDFVRKNLALPDELAVFYWNDPFRDNPLNLPAPVYSGSSKKIVEKKEYECDTYTIDIKNLNGAPIIQEFYNVLYEGEKLSRIQKFIRYNGKEYFLRETEIKEITSDVPNTAFTFGKKIKVYAAKNGDMQDLLGQAAVVEILGVK